MPVNYENVFKEVERCLVTGKNRGIMDDYTRFVGARMLKSAYEIVSVGGVYETCTRGFKERSTKLEGDLKRLNTNINTMKVSINASTVGGETQNTQTVTQQTVVQNSADILSDLYESYSMNILNEAEDNNNKSTKVVNNGDSGNNENTPQKNNVKKMTWYLSGNTDVFSAKMKIMRQRYLDCIKIFRAAFPKEKEKKETNQVEVKATNAQQIEV
jgi:hypothetical protein